MICQALALEGRSFRKDLLLGRARCAGLIILNRSGHSSFHCRETVLVYQLIQKARLESYRIRYESSQRGARRFVQRIVTMNQCAYFPLPSPTYMRGAVAA